MKTSILSSSEYDTWLKENQGKYRIQGVDVIGNAQYRVEFYPLPPSEAQSVPSQPPTPVIQPQEQKEAKESVLAYCKSCESPLEADGTCLICKRMAALLELARTGKTFTRLDCVGNEGCKVSAEPVVRHPLADP